LTRPQSAFIVAFVTESVVLFRLKEPPVVIQPYLYFDGRCEEALEFYKKTLGAQVTNIHRFKDAPPNAAMNPPGSENKIMHAAFKIGSSELLASDGDCRGQTKFQGISLSLTVPNADQAHRVFTALSEGGHAQMPMMKTFFSPAFGMVADRFGVSWMVLATPTM
jgi:PhnB protein